MGTGCDITDNRLRSHTNVVAVAAFKGSRAGGGEPQEGVFDVGVGVDV